MRDDARGSLCVAGAALLWGTWPLYVRAGGHGGVLLAGLAMAAMALPAPFAVRRADFRDRVAVLCLVVVGVADAANAALYFTALARGPVVVAVLTHYLAPLLVALLAPLVLGEVRSLRALAAAPVVLLGLALVLGLAQGGDLTTAGLGAGSAVFYATLVLASRRAARTFSALAITSLHAVVSLAGLLAVFGAAAVPAHADAGLALAVLGALVNGLLAAVLFNAGLRLVTAQLAGVLTFLEPLTASLLGVAFLGDHLTAPGAAGVALVLGAGAWVALQRRPAP